MSLIRFEEISLEFGEQKILTNASLAIEPAERICLIGRNGAGKSSTLKLLTGELEPDRGSLIASKGLVISQLAQTIPDTMQMSVTDMVRSGLSGIERLLEEYTRRSQSDLDSEGLQELQELHQQIDAHCGWHIYQRVQTIMTELCLPADREMHQLSGGWRRRVALATALVQKPDLLLLDEPTNHLDIVTIEWLERIIYSYPGTVLFITHDRAFLQRLATRIVEIDRGKLTSWPGDYQNFLRRKEKALEDEATLHSRFDKRLGPEEAWIRQGIKVLRTRNEGRARALVSMRAERVKRVEPADPARINIEAADKSGRKVIRARNVHYRFDDRPLIEDFSINIMRGDRIGILGNNGVGKTTLLRLLLGKLEPQRGTIKQGTHLKLAYYDQMRDSLALDKSVADNVSDGRSYIKLNGKERHVVGYLKGFLFSPKRSMMPVSSLSGGEKNRIILAKLFTKAANLLVLDEPTNDLDVETLEVLEQQLVQFPGTLIVVSHDRQFLDNVVTSTIVFEEQAKIREYVGGYTDWLRQGRTLEETDNPVVVSTSHKQMVGGTVGRRPRKPGYREIRELEKLPGQIEVLESDIERLQRRIASPGFYATGNIKVQAMLLELRAQQEKLDSAMERWAELEQRQQQYDETRKELNRD